MTADRPRWRNRRNTDPKFDVVIVSKAEWNGYQWITFAPADPGDDWAFGPIPEVTRADWFHLDWRQVPS